MSRSIPQIQKDRVRRRLNFDRDEEDLETQKHPKHQNEEKLATAQYTLENQDNLEPHKGNEIKIIDFTNMTEEEKMKQMERWNFDFENGQPLPGRWEWERLGEPVPVKHEKIVKNWKDSSNDDTNDRNI